MNDCRLRTFAVTSFVTAISFCSCAQIAPVPMFGGPNKNRVVVHVPESVDDTMKILPGAADRAHVTLVNVSGAVPDSVWGPAVSYATSRIQLNVWTNSVEVSVVDKLVSGAVKSADITGNKNARIGVYFERRNDADEFIVSPGRWCVANVSVLDKGNPDAQTKRDRMAKFVLRALAYAGGAGQSVDSGCSMYVGASNVEGLDDAGIALTPMTYFPLVEALRMIAGEDIVTREVE